MALKLVPKENLYVEVPKTRLDRINPGVAIRRYVLSTKEKGGIYIDNSHILQILMSYGLGPDGIKLIHRVDASIGGKITTVYTDNDGLTELEVI